MNRAEMQRRHHVAILQAEGGMSRQEAEDAYARIDWDECGGDATGADFLTMAEEAALEALVRESELLNLLGAVGADTPSEQLPH